MPLAGGVQTDNVAAFRYEDCGSKFPHRLSTSSLCSHLMTAAPFLKNGAYFRLINKRSKKDKKNVAVSDGRYERTVTVLSSSSAGRCRNLVTLLSAAPNVCLKYWVVRHSLEQLVKLYRLHWLVCCACSRVDSFYASCSPKRSEWCRVQLVSLRDDRQM